MKEYTVRSLTSKDYNGIAELEREIFASAGEKLLCPYYIRLCCEFFGETCFIALDGDRPIGYLLAFVKGDEVYCTTLAIRPEYQRTRAIIQLLKAFLTAVIDSAETCWFTVDEDNQAARALHRMLGASEVGVRKDFYGEGDHRIVSKIDRAQFETLRPKYERLGLVPRSTNAKAAVAA